MMVLIAPDKDLDLDPCECSTRTYIQMFKKTEDLLDVLKKKSAEDLRDLMGLGKKLAKSHVERFEAFHRMPPKQAVLLFGGKHLNAPKFTEKEVKYAQENMRIISGLYGMLRPYDDVKAVCELPMDAELRTKKGETVAEYWGESIAKMIAKDLTTIASNSKEDSTKVWLLNCLPDEYEKAIDPHAFPDVYKYKNLNVHVKYVKIRFKDVSDKDKTICRQLLANFIVTERITSLHDVKNFKEGGFQLHPSSKFNDEELIFVGQSDVGDQSPERSSKKKKKKERSRSPVEETRKKRDRSGSPAEDPKRRGRSGSPPEDRRKKRSVEETRKRRDRSGSPAEDPKRRGRSGSPPEDRRKKRR